MGAGFRVCNSVPHLCGSIEAIEEWCLNPRCGWDMLVRD